MILSQIEGPQADIRSFSYVNGATLPCLPSKSLHNSLRRLPHEPRKCDLGRRRDKRLGHHFRLRRLLLPPLRLLC